MYRAKDIAYYIVTYCTLSGCPINNLQLQKILYYIQKTFLREKNTPAFCDRIEAWTIGPVIPDVYYRFCGNGAMPIALTFAVDINPDDQHMFNYIIEQKSGLMPWDLVSDVQKDGSAWARNYKNPCSRNTISIEDIKKYG